MGYGIGGYLSLSKQTSGGTATTNRVYIPFVSESLTENKEQLFSENLTGKFDQPKAEEGINNVTGDIVFEPHPIYLGHFLRAAVAAPTSTLATSAYVHEFLPAQADYDSTLALLPYTIEVYKSVGDAYRIVDGQIHTLAIEMQAGAIVRATAGVHGRAYSQVTKQTPSYINADPYTWNEASINIGGSANNELQSATVTLANPIEGVPLLNGSKNEGKIKRSGFRTVNITGDQDFSSETEQEKFSAQTRQRFLITVTGKAIGGSAEILTIDCPDVNYSTYAYPIGGAGRIVASYDGNAEYDTTSSYAVRYTLTNTQATY